MDLNQDQHYEDIEAFINNVLSAEDKTSFEQKIKENPSLKKAVLHHVLANEALSLAIEDNIANKLDKLAKKRIESEPKQSISWWKRPLAVAASILILVIAGLAIFANQNYSNQALSKKLYAESTLPTVRSEYTNNPNYANGIVAFTQGNYTESIQLFSKIPSTDKAFLPTQYLLGHAYLKTKNYDSANLAFESILSAPNIPQTIDKEEVEWNQLLAVMNITSVKREVFQEKLGKIVTNPQHAHYADALILTQQLTNFMRHFTLY